MCQSGVKGNFYAPFVGEGKRAIAFSYPTIRSRGEENIKIPGYRARRWVVERTHSWLNRFRRLTDKVGKEN
jgi:transposase